MHGEIDINMLRWTGEILHIPKRYGEYKNEISQDCSNDMQEVGSTHSTEEASNDREGKGLTQN